MLIANYAHCPVVHGMHIIISTVIEYAILHQWFILHSFQIIKHLVQSMDNFSFDNFNKQIRLNYQVTCFFTINVLSKAYNRLKIKHIHCIKVDTWYYNTLFPKDYSMNK